MKLLTLILTLLAFPALATPISITEAGCPSQMLDIQGGQLVCFTAPPPPPPPPPPPVGAACPVAPNLNNLGPVINGMYFTDCGQNTQLRSPNPTATYWHLVGGLANRYSMCIQPGSFQQEAWRFPGGNVTISNNDMRLILNENISGNLTISGSRINLTTINGKGVNGDVICGANAHNVEINGECVCQ